MRWKPASQIGKPVRGLPAYKSVQQSLERLKGAYAESTLRSYKTDFEVFMTWCMTVNENALPAEPEAVARFVLVDAAHSQSSTVRRRIAAIGRIHRLNRYPTQLKAKM